MNELEARPPLVIENPHPLKKTGIEFFVFHLNEEPSSGWYLVHVLEGMYVAEPLDGWRSVGWWFMRTLIHTTRKGFWI